MNLVECQVRQCRDDGIDDNGGIDGGLLNGVVDITIINIHSYHEHRHHQHHYYQLDKVFRGYVYRQESIGEIIPRLNTGSSDDDNVYDNYYDDDRIQ